MDSGINENNKVKFNFPINGAIPIPSADYFASFQTYIYFIEQIVNI